MTLSLFPHLPDKISVKHSIIIVITYLIMEFALSLRSGHPTNYTFLL